MNGDLAGRRRENEPSLARVDGAETENVAKKRPSLAGIAGKQDDMRSFNHGRHGR